VLGVELAEPPEIGEGVDTRRVSVAPGQLDGVVADLTELPELRIPGIHESGAGAMPLTARARAISAQDPMGDPVYAPVRPGDLEDAGAVRGFHPGGRGARVRSHGAGSVGPGPSGCKERAFPGKLLPPSEASVICEAYPVANPSEAVQCRPLEVGVGDKGIERAIKHLKRKMAAEGILRELKRRRHYMKPSIKRRKKMSEAARRRRKREKTFAF